MGRGTICFLSKGKALIEDGTSFIEVIPDKSSNCNLDKVVMDLSWEDLMMLKGALDRVFEEEDF